MFKSKSIDNGTNAGLR